MIDQWLRDPLWQAGRQVLYKKGFWPQEPNTVLIKSSARSNNGRIFGSPKVNPLSSNQGSVTPIVLDNGPCFWQSPISSFLPSQF